MASRARPPASPGPPRRVDPSHLLPLVGPVRALDRRGVRADLVAGVTVAAMLVPQGMAYAQLAGVPPIAGLYASTLPLVAYALLATSRHVAFGPTATAAIVVASSVAPLAGGDATHYVALASALAIIAGIIGVVAGALRLGFVVSFLSRPVLLGYTAGIALIIIASQLAKLVGVPTEGDLFFDRLASLVRGVDETSVVTLALAVGCIAVLLVLRRFRPRWPAALIVAVASTVVVAVLDLADHGVSVTGDVPRGLPGLGVPDVGWDDVESLLPAAFAVALITYVDTIAAGKGLSLRRGYDMDGNRELLAVGAGNIASGLVGGFSIDGSFSRTAVNAQAGGRTQLSGLVTAVLIAAVLLVLTPLFQNLPDAALGAIVVTAVAPLIEAAPLRRLAGRSRDEFTLAMVALVATLVLGVLPGILIAVVASLLVFIHRTSHPNTAVLGWEEADHTWRDTTRFPSARQPERVLAFRFDGPIFFGTADLLRDEVRALVTERGSSCKGFVLDCQAVSYVDITGAETITALRTELEGRGVRFALSALRAPQRDRVLQYGHPELLGAAVLFPTTEAAIAALDR